MNKYDCVPEALEPETPYHSAEFTCSGCENRDCENWLDYNFESQAERDEGLLWEY